MQFLPALLVGTGSLEIVALIIICAIHCFFFTRWIIRKIWPNQSNTSITLASLLVALILSPFVAYLIIILILIATDFNG